MTIREKLKDRVFKCFAHGLKLFLSDSYSVLGLLQSSIHYWWAAHVSSSFRKYIRYSTSSSFDTFPISDQVVNSEVLGDFAKDLESEINRISERENIGLTKLYNKINDPDNSEKDIGYIRNLNLLLDQAVLDAYGWSDLTIRHEYCDTPQGVRLTLPEHIRD